MALQANVKRTTMRNSYWKLFTITAVKSVVLMMCLENKYLTDINPCKIYKGYFQSLHLSQSWRWCWQHKSLKQLDTQKNVHNKNRPGSHRGYLHSDQNSLACMHRTCVPPRSPCMRIHQTDSHNVVHCSGYQPMCKHMAWKVNR